MCKQKGTAFIEAAIGLLLLLASAWLLVQVHLAWSSKRHQDAAATIAARAGTRSYVEKSWRPQQPFDYSVFRNDIFQAVDNYYAGIGRADLGCGRGLECDILFPDSSGLFFVEIKRHFKFNLFGIPIYDQLLVGSGFNTIEKSPVGGRLEFECEQTAQATDACGHLFTAQARATQATLAAACAEARRQAQAEAEAQARAHQQQDPPCGNQIECYRCEGLMLKSQLFSSSSCPSGWSPSPPDCSSEFRCTETVTDRCGHRFEATGTSVADQATACARAREAAERLAREHGQQDPPSCQQFECTQSATADDCAGHRFTANATAEANTYQEACQLALGEAERQARARANEHEQQDRSQGLCRSCGPEPDRPQCPQGYMVLRDPRPIRDSNGCITGWDFNQSTDCKFQCPPEPARPTCPQGYSEVNPPRPRRDENGCIVEWEFDQQKDCQRDTFSCRRSATATDCAGHQFTETAEATSSISEADACQRAQSDAQRRAEEKARDHETLDRGQGLCGKRTCYQCDGTQLVTREFNQDSCPAGWSPNPPDCQREITCYSCENGQSMTRRFTGDQCPQGWQPSPVNCEQEVVCYQCSGGQVQSRRFSGSQCPAGWQPSPPNCQQSYSCTRSATADDCAGHRFTANATATSNVSQQDACQQAEAEAQARARADADNHDRQDRASGLCKFECTQSAKDRDCLEHTFTRQATESSSVSMQDACKRAEDEAKRLAREAALEHQQQHGCGRTCYQCQNGTPVSRTFDSDQCPQGWQPTPPSDCCTRGKIKRCYQCRDGAVYSQSADECDGCPSGWSDREPQVITCYACSGDKALPKQFCEKCEGEWKPSQPDCAPCYEIEIEVTKYICNFVQGSVEEVTTYDRGYSKTCLNKTENDVRTSKWPPGCVDNCKELTCGKVIKFTCLGQVDPNNCNK